jgi:hypothetical protein
MSPVSKSKNFCNGSQPISVFGGAITPSMSFMIRLIICRIPFYSLNARSFLPSVELLMLGKNEAVFTDRRHFFRLASGLRRS